MKTVTNPISLMRATPVTHVALELNSQEEQDSVRFEGLSHVLSKDFTIQARVQPYMVKNTAKDSICMTVFTYWIPEAKDTKCFTYFACQLAPQEINLRVTHQGQEKHLVFKNTGEQSLIDDAWHQLIIVWSTHAGSFQVYWDHQLMDAKESSQFSDYQVSDEPAMLVLGQNIDPDTGKVRDKNYYTGKIGALRIWNTGWPTDIIKTQQLPTYAPAGSWTKMATKTVLKKLTVYDQLLYGINAEGYLVTSSKGIFWSRTQARSPLTFLDMAVCNGHVIGVSTDGQLYHSNNQGAVFQLLTSPAPDEQIVQVGLNDQTPAGLSLAVRTTSNQVYYYLGFSKRTYQVQNWKSLTFNEQTGGFSYISGFLFFLQAGQLYSQKISAGSLDNPLDLKMPQDERGQSDPIIQVTSLWPWNVAALILCLGQSGNLYRYNPMSQQWSIIQHAKSTFLIQEIGMTHDYFIFALDNKGNLYKSASHLILSGPDNISVGVRLTLDVPLNEGYGLSVFSTPPEGTSPVHGSIQQASREGNEVDNTASWVVSDRLSQNHFIHAKPHATS